MEDNEIMASMYGYVILLVGMSLLLSMVGVNTGVGAIMDKYFKFTDNSNGSFNITSLNNSEFRVGSNSNGTGGSDSLFWVFTIFGLGGIIGITAWALGRSIAETAKAGFAGLVFGLALADFSAIISYASSMNIFGGVLAIITFLIYIPIGFGYIVTALNWIGGGQ